MVINSMASIVTSPQPLELKPNKAETTTFEYPLSESMRLYLHLEHQFTHFSHALTHQPHHFAHNAVNLLLSLLKAIDRPDLKTRLMQTLSQYATALKQLQQIPHVNTEKLNLILTEINLHTQTLLNQHAKFGESLNGIEILNQLKAHSSPNSGACPYKIPAYQLWLSQPNMKLSQQLNEWADQLKSLSEIVNSILTMTRDSTQFHTIKTERGFYQQTLNSALPFELLQLKIPSDIQAYPVFTVGKHRIAFTLMEQLTFNSKPHQLLTSDLLELSLCKV